MPNPKRRGYFGPCKDRPPHEASRRVVGGKNKGGTLQENGYFMIAKI